MNIRITPTFLTLITISSCKNGIEEKVDQTK